MRYVALAVILASLPAFIAWLQSNPRNRDLALTLMGALVFATGSLRVSTDIYGMAGWTGMSTGFGLSPVDTLALALLLTRKRSGRALPFTWLIVANLAVLAFSVLLSQVWIASAFAVWDFLRVFLVFLAVGGEVARSTAYPALLRGLSIGLMVQAAYVIQQKLSGVVQATGTLPHQNALGMMAGLVLLNLLAAMLEGERSWLMKLGALAGAIVIAGGGSRAAIGFTGCAALVLIILSIARRPTPGKWGIAAAGAVVMAAAGALAMATLTDRFDGDRFVRDEGHRMAMESAARSIASDHPFGVGVNSFAFISNTQGYAERANISWAGTNRSAPVHNAYLLARAETGYQGEITFALMLFVPTVAGLVFAFRHRSRPRDGWPLGAAVALGAVSVHSVYEFNSMVYAIQLPLLMTIAIIAGAIRAFRLAQDDESPVSTVNHGQSADPALPAMPRIPTARMAGKVSVPDGALPSPSRPGSRR
ncbi:MAG TPA: O-antigen ligase family protein [Croceibacterium sp.]|nr:O-antigen ligase family protein [Croceibacterium sp.]